MADSDSVANRDSVADRLVRVQGRIAEAAARRGDGPAVTLVAVSKRQPVHAIEAAVAAGQRAFGENYAQELQDKREQIGNVRAQWHFIGGVQTNKAKRVIGCTLVHTADRASIIAALESRAASAGLTQDVLVQVNVGDDPAKGGVAVTEVDDLLDRFADCDHVRCRGLMTMPPLGDPHATRPHFRTLRRLADRLARRNRPRVEFTELSMGMSSDFEVAIEEGASIVRVGTAVFGRRPGPAGVHRVPR